MTYPNFFHLNSFCQLSYPSSISLAKVEKKKIRSNAWVAFLASFTFCPNTDITDLIILLEWTDYWPDHFTGVDRLKHEVEHYRVQQREGHQSAARQPLEAGHPYVQQVQ